MGKKDSVSALTGELCSRYPQDMAFGQLAEAYSRVAKELLGEFRRFCRKMQAARRDFGSNRTCQHIPIENSYGDVPEPPGCVDKE